MTRVAITGATGFLGGTLARRLHAQGADVVALGRSDRALAELSDLGMNAVSIDLGHPFDAALSERIGALDAVVHCAALSSAWGPMSAFSASNVAGTETAIALARAGGAKRFVNISSPTIYYANRDQMDVREDHPLPKPINAYAHTKRLGEARALAATDIGPINLRPRGIFGAGDTALVPRLLDAATRGPLPHLRDGIAEIDLTHVDDVVSAICAALAAGPEAEGQSFNISSGETRRVRDIVDRVCESRGVSVRWKPVPWRVAMALAGASESVGRLARPTVEPRLTRYKLGLFAFRQSLDISKAHDEFGWAPEVGLDDGIGRTLAEWSRH